MTSQNKDRPTAPATAEAGQPKYADRVYRSLSGVCTGVVLLLLALWIGGDAVFRGHGRTPWLTLASLLLALPLLAAFTVRPAVFANAERIRVRNPFRTITLPWTAVDAIRASYSTELFAGDKKYQLWAIPVSLRARKRASRQTARGKMTEDPFSATGRRRGMRPGTADDDGTVRAWSDQTLRELRELLDQHPAGDEPQPAPVVRWAYEVIAPAVAGAVVLIVLLAIGG